MPAYTVMTYEDKREKNIEPLYSVLKGPDGFLCDLTKPEDRSWVRDGAKVVKQLNDQHNEIVKLKERIDELKHLDLTKL